MIMSYETWHFNAVLIILFQTARAEELTKQNKKNTGNCPNISCLSCLYVKA